MKSKMITCYDYRELPVEPKLRLWRYPDSEIEQELEALARDHSGEQEIIGPVAEGDSVRLSCMEASAEGWKGRSILLFPGRKLPGAEEAEKAVLGKKAGEVINCRIRNVEVSLKIEEILRRRQMNVDESLIQEIAIEGVHSLEDYYRWYHQEHDGEKRKKAWIAIVQYWLTEIAARSEFEIDEEEKRDWCYRKSSFMYQAFLAAGIDLRKPTEERPKSLTEEEVIAEEAKKQERYFVPYVIYRYFCEKDGFVITEEMFLEEIRKIAVERGMDEAEALKQTHIELYREIKYQEHTFYMLGREAEKYLED